ncbi:aldo/keto reductase [Naasia sp. SYSU D00948]|uniref:aldo/keto reductase n=1 Tax=Naasia sp. SYSU D00948 TaxID=2817379 RepID=UPI001B31286E|nr:aldo/keto reductase [Naasia sp. SYSU D00948]
MRSTRLGASDLEVSRIALGTMTFGWEASREESFAILDAYAEAGGNFLDTADVYSNGASEEILGEWLRGRDRDRFVVATKGRFPVAGQPSALSKEYLDGALDASLRRLGLDHVDLYQAHAPDSRHALAEFAEFLEGAYRSGKVRYGGVSNMTAAHLVELHLAERELGIPHIIALQPQYSLLVRDVELEILPTAQLLGIGSIAWGPLAAGWLTGKYVRDAPPPEGSRLGDDPERGVEAWSKRGTEQTWSVLEVLERVAREAGQTQAVVSLAWLLSRPGLSSAIVGARSVDQLTGTVGASDVDIDPALLEQLSAVSAPELPGYYALMAQNARQH